MTVYTEYDTIRERARRLLDTATEPLTTAAIANRLDTTPHQAHRALRQLEQQGSAHRHSSPAQWTAAS